MTPLLNNWTIVLVGRWNLEILNPEWVGENLFDDNDIDVDVVLDGMTTKIRYQINNVVFLPRSDRITFAVTDVSDDALNAMEKAARLLLERLPVTPISAVGINFTFVEKNAPAKLTRLFDFNDMGDISDAGYTLSKTSLRREFEFEDRSMNFIATYAESGARLALNFHAEARKSEVASEKVTGRVVRFRDHAIGFLEQMYGLTVEEAEIDA